jgi:transposase
LVGAVNLNKLSEVHLFEYDSVNADAMVHFLRHIHAQHSFTGKIHLILDQAGYHRALEVKNEAKKLNIKLHYLLPCSPNLNPIERLWKVMNEYARNNRFFKGAKVFRESLYHFFKKTLPEIANLLSSRINDNFQIL